MQKASAKRQRIAAPPTTISRRSGTRARTVDNRRLIGTRVFTQDTRHDDRNVVRTAAEIRDINQRLHCLSRSQTLQNGADFGIRHLPAEAIAAEQKDVAVDCVVGSFEIEIYGLVWTKRAA